jgi:hypothetical protein
MRYSLLPFPSLNEAGGPDIREQLRVRRSMGSSVERRGGNLEILEYLVPVLQGLPWDIRVDQCYEQGGEVRLAVVAMNLGRDVKEGDRVNAGLYVESVEGDRCEARACERVYRVVCRNGSMVECEKGQSAVLEVRDPHWEQKLAGVVGRSFMADGLDVDLARFRATVRQMLMTPYELLCNLVAQRIISEDEQVRIQREFDTAGDCTLYGLINAVTCVARRLRDFDDWRRSFDLERLGGEILRGDHRAAVADPVVT